MRASRRFRVALGCVLGVLLAGTACAAPPTPLLWKASKGTSTVWLLGSMHILKDTDYPLSPDVEGAYAKADRMFFEVAPDDMKSPATVALILKYGMQQDQHTMKDDVPADTWNRVEAYGAKNGLSEPVLLKFKPWMLAVTMIALESQKLGMDPDKGLDMHFMGLAKADHKPASGLETVDQQLSIFYTSSTHDQVEMLRQTLDEIADFPKEMGEEHDAWRRGDGKQMATDAKKEFAEYPELYRKLVVQRNDNWVPQIEQMLRDSGHGTLVIVGALHLVGSDGVVSKLQHKGYTVERICTGCVGVR